MNISRSSQRGSSLLIAMIVLVLATLMVVGAITFTGQERTAAVMQSRGDQMSACAQAARNMVLSRLRVMQGNILGMNTTIPVTTMTVDGKAMKLSAGHYSGASPNVQINKVKQIERQKVGGNLSQVYDLSNTLGTKALLSGYYNVSAVCLEDTNTSGSPEREIEFTIKVGL